MPVAELQFFTGTMDSGKSTLALQTNHNHAVRGRIGRIFTTQDRAGTATLSSRLGLTHEAIEVDEQFDFWRYVVDALTQGARIDYLICDEAQFFQPFQIDQLARIADELQIDVFCFGILTDFRTMLFPGSARLVELADRMNVLQVEALCWCGRRATPQRPHRERRDGHRGRGDRRRRDHPRRGRAARGRLRGPLPPAPPAPDDHGAGSCRVADLRAAPVRRLTCRRSWNRSSASLWGGPE